MKKKLANFPCPYANFNVMSVIGQQERAWKPGGIGQSVSKKKYPVVKIHPGKFEDGPGKIFHIFDPFWLISGLFSCAQAGHR